MGSCWENTWGFLKTTQYFTYPRKARVNLWKEGLLRNLLKFVVVIIIATPILLVLLLVIIRAQIASESASGETFPKFKGFSTYKMYYPGYEDVLEEDSFTDFNELVENGYSIAFIPTQIEQTLNQQKGECLYPKFPCDTDANCTGWDEKKQIAAGQGTCNTTYHRCMYRQWCPVEDPSNDLGLNHTSVIELDVRNFTIWMRASINFPNFAPGFEFSTVNSADPVSKPDNPTHFNLFTIDDMVTTLRDQGEEPLTYADIRSTGFVGKLTVLWDCWFGLYPVNGDITQCDISYETVRLDADYSGVNQTSGGYNERKVFYTDIGGSTEQRDLRKEYGIKVYFSSEGVAEQYDWSSMFFSIFSYLFIITMLTGLIDFLCLSYVEGRYKTNQGEKYQQIHHEITSISKKESDEGVEKESGDRSEEEKEQTSERNIEVREEEEGKTTKITKV